MKQKATKEERRYLARLLFSSTKYHRRYMSGSIFLSAIHYGLNDLVNPVIVAYLLKDIAQAKEITSVHPYIKYFVALVVVELLTLTCRRFASYLEDRFDSYTRKAIVSNTFSNLLEQPAYFHQSRFVGSTVNLISKCADSFGMISHMTYSTVVGIVVSFIGTSAILFGRMPWYVLALAVASLVYTKVISALLPRQMKLSSDASEESAKMYGAISDAISNISAVKSESSEGREHSHVMEISSEWVQRKKLYAKHVMIRDGFVSNSIVRSLRVLSIVFAIYAAVGHRENAPVLFLATTLTANYLGHLWDFGDNLYEVTVMLGEAAPIVPLLRSEVGVPDDPDAQVLSNVSGAIAIKGVTYSYPNTDVPVFEDLNVSIAAGERVGIVGRSGAGKSTLVKLIMRFVDTQSGTILIDDHDATTVTQESLRDNISYVSQEPILFHRSVRDNIVYGSDNVTDEQVMEVLRRSHSDEFVEQLPRGLRSVVGERGVNLSGGQRQRIAIARAMLKNAPILILDEATSALDSESEKYVQAAFAELMKDRTTIVVAHRLSTLLNMDRILVFDRGRVVEQGTHAELVKGDGIYSALWAHQAGGFLGAE